MGDLLSIGGSTVLVCAVVAAVGALALRVVRSRSLVLSVVVAALTPLAAVSLAVVVNVRLMFLSAHDSQAVQLALGLAVVVAVALAVALGRRVAGSSRELASQVRGLSGAASPAVGTAPRTAPPGAPAELAALAAELAATRGRLDEAQRRARAVDESRRELVAFMSHDLRTPMAGLRALAEGLEDGVVDPATGLRQIRQTVERMNGLVTDLFEVSRLQSEARTQPARRRLVSLVEVSLDVVGELAAHAERHRVRLVLRTGDADRLAVLGDADELTRALTNLVGNAVRHTAPGGEVVVEAVRREDGRVAVAVTDGCGGIGEADLPRVFDLGWRADPGRSQQGAGAGLGLAIARGVAEAHDGSIGVVNVPGGCRFALVLPARTG